MGNAGRKANLRARILLRARARVGKGEAGARAKSNNTQSRGPDLAQLSERPPPFPSIRGRHKLPTTCPLFLCALLSTDALHRVAVFPVVVVVIPSLGSLRAERAADIPSQSPSFTLTPSPIPCISRRLFHRDTTVATLSRQPSIPPGPRLARPQLSSDRPRHSRSLARRSGSGSDLPWRRHPMLL
jgi:hypothetical protein